MVHRRRCRHRAWIEGLHLVSAKAVLFQPHGKVHHVFVASAGVCSNEVRNQVLLFTCLGTVLFKHLFELVVAANAGLHHLGERTVFRMLRRDLQVATYVVRDQLFDVLGRFDSKVVAQPRANQNLLHAFELARTAIHVDERAVVGIEVAANPRIDTRGFAAGRLNLGRFAADAVHVGCRTT